MITGSVPISEVRARRHGLSASPYLLRVQVLPLVQEHLKQARAILAAAKAQGISLSLPTHAMVAGDLGLPVGHITRSLEEGP